MGDDHQQLQSIVDAAVENTWNQIYYFKPNYKIHVGFRQDKESIPNNFHHISPQQRDTVKGPGKEKFAATVPQPQQIDNLDESSEFDWRDHSLPIKSKLSYILANETFSDVVFIVGQEKVKVFCHKLILMCASSVLQKILQNVSESIRPLKHSSLVPRNQHQNNCNNYIEIVLPNVSEAAFKCFLKYVYTDKFEVSMENALEVLSISKTYGVQALLERCLALLKCNISEKNVLAIYQAANKMDERELYDAALAFIFRNPEKVITITSAAFLTLSEDNLCYLLERDEIKLDELTLFLAVQQWGIHKCKIDGLDESLEEDLRFVLKRPIKLIRFPLLTPEQLSIHVVPTRALTDSELVELYKYMSLNSRQRNSAVLISFSTRKREIKSKGSVFPINRLDGIGKNPWSCGDTFWRVDFMVNRSISIHGYGFLGSFETSNSMFDVEIQLIGPKMCMVSKEIIPTPKARESFQVKFIEPIVIKGNVWYTAAFRYSGPPTLQATRQVDTVSLHCGDTGRVTFVFKEAGENTAAKQLSHVLFSL